VLPPANDTIAALATARGAGAVAILRISGPDALSIAARVTRRELHPRRVEVCAFRGPDGSVIDRGLAFSFPAPSSYTGEDVVELHCHGSAIVVDWLLETLHELGARPAQPGEFTLRAFLNDKLDLAQAEAVADLVGSGSRAEARAALRSLTGEFSRRVEAIQMLLTQLRVLCEAWLDFPDEEIDREAQAELETRAADLERQAAILQQDAANGALLHDGFSIAIAGPPNAGKSSLLNRLSGHDAAIVTPVPGTTRDTIRESVPVDGLLLEVVDTAGLRKTTDPVEMEGVRRAQRAVQVADHILWVADIRQGVRAALDDARTRLPPASTFTLLLNKVDLEDAAGETYALENIQVLELSALTGAGFPQLTEHLKRLAGWNEAGSGTFSARRRHLDTLHRAHAHILCARAQIGPNLEIAAEELRNAQTALSEITGELTSDDLLGEIFASFCIGK
jgi:tRNA modification GTPase